MKCSQRVKYRTFWSHLVTCLGHFRSSITPRTATDATASTPASSLRRSGVPAATSSWPGRSGSRCATWRPPTRPSSQTPSASSGTWNRGKVDIVKFRFYHCNLGLSLYPQRSNLMDGNESVNNNAVPDSLRDTKLLFSKTEGALSCHHAIEKIPILKEDSMII